MYVYYLHTYCYKIYTFFQHMCTLLSMLLKFTFSKQLYLVIILACAVHEKTNNLGFRPGPTQICLYNLRSRLEPWNFRFKRKRYCTIYGAKTKACSYCTADLLLFFCISRLLVFLCSRSYSRKSHFWLKMVQ